MNSTPLISATPNKVHTPAVIAALEAGKHVLCEKPLAVSTAEILAIREALRKTDRILMTAQHHRFSEASVGHQSLGRHRRAGRSLSRPRQRDPAQLASHQSRVHRSQFKRGGPCMDIGVHALDTALWLMKFSPAGAGQRTGPYQLRQGL